MADAATEMHLLRDAEAFLGAAVWRQIQSIEKLSVEYWNLRKLVKERDIILKKIEEKEQLLEKAHNERAQVLNTIPEENQELIDQRIALLKDLEALAVERDRVIGDARDIRRLYVGLKMKLEVLNEEPGDKDSRQEEILKVEARLEELRQQFEDLKKQRQLIGEKIERGDLKIDQYDEDLKKERAKRRELASSAFQAIGEGNRQISLLRAQHGEIETQMHQIYGLIGRYVSRNTANDPNCASAAHAYRSLVDVMRALRRSVALNHRLAGYR